MYCDNVNNAFIKSVQIAIAHSRKSSKQG